MHDAHDFLVNLAMVFGVAAVVTVVFHRLRLPVVLGYLLAGMMVGPHVPLVPLVADPGIVNALSELGVVLLMFGIGLEFDLRRLVALAPTAGLVALAEVSFAAWLGYQAAQLAGRSTVESLFTGAVVSISSTSIIALAFDERGVSGAWREVVFGILVVEDLVAILLLVGLALVAGGASVEPASLAGEVARLGASLAALLAVGLLVVPRFFRYVVASGRRETVVVSSVGLCFGIALLVQWLGYSVALGAFLAGMMVAESGRGHEVFEVVRPLRDAFAALFFVAVGMLIDPTLVLSHAGSVAALAGVVVVAKVVGVGLGSFLVGHGLRTSVQAGLSMTQIGEFSFVIAALGVKAGVVGEALYPVAVAVSAVTTFTTPYAIRLADPLARWLDHKLPRRLQLWTSLYTGWVTQLRASAEHPDRRRAVLVGLVLDVGLLVAIAAAHGLYAAPVADVLCRLTGLDGAVASGALAGLAALLAAPLAFGVVRLSGSVADDLLRPLAATLSDAAPGVVPALSAGVRVAVSSLAGLVALALSMPWLPVGPTALAFLGVEAFLVVVLWRSTARMQDEITPGAALLARAILQGTASGAPHDHEDPAPRGVLVLDEGDFGAGQTLVQLDLRARTGASVVALQARGADPGAPTGREPLAAGTRLTLVGSEEAVLAAERLLRHGASTTGPEPARA